MFPSTRFGFSLYRIRKAFEDQLDARLESPLEADETYIGGKLKNMHASKRPPYISGTAGKTPVVAVRSRPTKKVKAKVTKTHLKRNSSKAGRRNCQEGVHCLYRSTQRIHRTQA